MSISVQSTDEASFRNHYKCPCGNEWTDIWSCQCNDRCSSCNKEIEPFESEDLNDRGDSGVRSCCQNCGTEHAENALKPVQNLTERVEPGEPMPSGECPLCGALCHRIDPLRLPSVKMTDISTGHVSERTADALRNEKSDLRNLLAYEAWADYGWIIFCSTDAADSVRATNPDIAHLIDVCVQGKVDFLKLDCDADRVAGLPWFDC